MGIFSVSRERAEWAPEMTSALCDTETESDKLFPVDFFFRNDGYVLLRVIEKYGNVK